MGVAGPNEESRESATRASPNYTHREGLCQTGASRLLRRCPKRQQGVAPQSACL
jgi:hypothetical protein